jgi:hypothetical protein
VPLPILHAADRVPERCSFTADAAELDRQRADHRLRLQVPAGSHDLVLKDVGECEVLQQRDQVGECLVKGKDVGVGRLVVIALHSIEDRVSGSWAMMSCDRHE